MADQVEEELFDEPENLSTHTLLHNKWTFWYLKRSAAKSNPTPYEENFHKVASFQTIEHFFRIYDHLLKPNDVKSMDYNMFKNNIKPAWEDENNKDGGKWVIRLRKGLASLYWEDLIFAMIGEQFDVGQEICGAVISIRHGQEDVISIWNKNADNVDATGRIKDQLRKILKVPSFISIEYKRHMTVLENKPHNAPSTVPHHVSSTGAPPRTWQPRNNEGGGAGAGHPPNKEYHKEGPGGLGRGGSYPRASAGSAGNKPPTSDHHPAPGGAGRGGQSTSMAWKPSRPNPVNASTGDPARDRELQEASGAGRDNFWVKSLKEKNGDASSDPSQTRHAPQEQSQGGAGWASKESPNPWRGSASNKPTTTERKPSAADSVKMWTRGKTAAPAAETSTEE